MMEHPVPVFHSTSVPIDGSSKPGGERVPGRTLPTLDSVLEGLEVGEPVDEALRGRLQEVRDALEEVFERSEREVEGAAQTALGKGQGPDTPASS